MPRKIPGWHAIHVNVREEYWAALQEWCASGIAKIPANLIINTLLEQFHKTHIQKGRGTDVGEVSDSIAASVKESIRIIDHKRTGR